MKKYKQTDKYKKYKKKYRLKNNVLERLRYRLWYAITKYTKTGKIYSSSKYGIDYKAIIEYLKPFPKDLSNYEIHHIKPLFTFKFIQKDGSTDLKEIKRAFTPKNHKWVTIEEHKEIHKTLNNSFPSVVGHIKMAIIERRTKDKKRI